MRVLHIISGLERGGAERTLLNLAAARRDPSIDHQVVVLGPCDTFYTEFLSEGVPVHYCSTPGRRRSLIFPLALRRYVKALKPDLIQGWMLHGNLAASLLRKFCASGVPVVWTVRGSLLAVEEEKARNRILLRMSTSSLLEPNVIVYNSDEARAQHEALGYSASRGRVISNGVEGTRFLPDEGARRRFRQHLGLSEDDFLVGLPARDDPLKDHETFLRAAEMTYRSNHQSRFVLAGTGIDQSPILQALIRQFGIEDRVVLLGPQDDMSRFYNGVDLVALSSISESFPNVLLEAQACGTPCIATDVGACRAIIAEQQDVVPPAKPELLSEAICRHLERSEEQRQAHAKGVRAFVQERYSMASMLDAFEGLYGSLRPDVGLSAAANTRKLTETFPAYSREPNTCLSKSQGYISSFVADEPRNLDARTVESFGWEWQKFQQLSDEVLRTIGDSYFDVVTPEMLPAKAYVLDAGCGSGRFSRYIASRVSLLEAIDPSLAVHAAYRMTENIPNVRVTQASIDDLPFPDGVFDFSFCLGVLHHMPDAGAGLTKIVEKTKPGGYVLVYLYYCVENRNSLYRFLYLLSDYLRRMISRLPFRLKGLVCDLLAFTIYLPLVGIAQICHKLFPRSSWPARLPLAYYSDKNFYVMRNDALDRFGTPLEKRFSRAQIEQLMRSAGLVDIVFSEQAPYWHAVGRRLDKN